MRKVPEWIVKYWIEWVFGLVTGGVAVYCRHIAKQVRKEREEQKALRDGMRSLLRRQIIADCEQAAREGYCETKMKDTINDMYTAYHALGGNGVVSRLKEQTMNLPVIKEDGSHA